MTNETEIVDLTNENIVDNESIQLENVTDEEIVKEGDVKMIEPNVEEKEEERGEEAEEEAEEKEKNEEIMEEIKRKYYYEDLNETKQGLVAKNLCFSVRKIKSYIKLQFERKHILKNISLEVKKGQLCCIMGPSGSGKSSLLDFLACRLKAGKRSGDIYFNGEKLKRSRFRKECGYVMQNDILLGTSTVHETLMFTALMKMGRKHSYKEKKERVKEIEQKFGLAECAKVKIGNNMIRGVSGGQRRRVSIATEIINNPDLLLLDEPTSGLDSFTSAKIIRILKGLAHRDNKCIIATIHQPSTEVFQMFDHCIILADGNTICQGSPKQLIEDCQKIGYPCPGRINPADHILNLVSNPFIKQQKKEEPQQHVQKMKDTEEKSVEEIKEEEQKSQKDESLRNMMEFLKHEDKLSSEELLQMRYDRILDIKYLFDDLPIAKEEKKEEKKNEESTTLKSTKKVSRPFFISRLFLLILRNVQSTWRDPLMFWSEFIQYVFGALFIGLLYLQPDLSPNGISDRIFAMLFILLGFSYVPSLTAISTFPEHRALFNRERDSNLYGTLEYYLSYSIVHILLEMIFPVICTLITYFMIGFHIKVDKFFIALATLILTQIASESFGLMVGSLVATIDVGVLLVSLLLIIWQTFSGFMVRNVGVYFKVFQYTSIFYYGLNILVQNEFLNRPDWEAVDNKGNKIDGAPMVSGQSIIDDAYPDGIPPIWVNFVVMISLVLLFRIVCYFILRFRRIEKK